MTNTTRTSPDFDVAIVGGGPAGVAAAIGIVTEGPSVVVLDQKGPGGQIATSSLIENVFGVGMQGKTGAELMGEAIDQAQNFGAKFRSLFTAVRLTKDEKTGIITLTSNNRERVTARAVLLALGASPRQLDVPGVSEYNNRGIYYGPPQYQVPAQWAGKKVGIIGGGNSAGQAGLFLANCDGCQTHVFVRGTGLEQDMSRYLIERFQKANITVHPHSTLTNVHGSRSLEKVIFDQNGAMKEHELDYLLIQIGAEPPTGWLEEVLALNKRGYILTDRDIPDGVWPEGEKRKPLRFETSMPGVFVSGDCHADTPKRMSVAVGEGHAVAVSVYQYLELSHELVAQPQIKVVA